MRALAPQWNIFVALSLLSLRSTIPLGLLVNSMRNMSDVLDAKFAILVLKIGEFNPGFLEVCSKALAVFWRAKLSLTVVFLISRQTVSLKEESFCPYSSPRKSPTLPKCHPASQRYEIYAPFLQKKQNIRNNLFYCLRIVPAALGWQKKKPYFYPTQHTLLWNDAARQWLLRAELHIII